MRPQEPEPGLAATVKSATRGILGGMGNQAGGRGVAGTYEEKPGARQVESWDRRTGSRERAHGGGPKQAGRGRAANEVRHILLLPAGLADGLGQEVIVLPQKRIRP